MLILNSRMPSILRLSLPSLALLLAGCLTDVDRPYTSDSEIVHKLDTIMTENQNRASTYRAERSSVPVAKPASASDLWWRADADTGLNDGPDEKISLETLYVKALQSSTQIKVFADIPLIRETGIQEAKGTFDTKAFAQAMLDRTNDPVGSELTTGRPGRFYQTAFTTEAGINKKLITGADVTLSQETGRTRNNSEFFTPNPQGDARLKLTVVQPLMKGGGVAYNRAIIEIAKIDSDIAQQELIRQAETHLLEIARSYWGLYLARTTFIQKRKLYEQSVRVTDDLKAREQIDALRSQIARGESAMAERRADLVRAELAIANAQDRIRALINDPTIGDMSRVELIPGDVVSTREYPVNYERAAQRALVQRPEVSQAMLQVKAAAVREKMQRHELLPVLNLIMEGYVAGLEKNGNTAGAVSNQFTDGGPGGGIGLRYEFPIENNVADARSRRRRIELRQQLSQLETTIETVLLEVKVSAREVRTAWRDFNAKLESVEAAREDLTQLEKRKEVDTAPNQFATDPVAGPPATSSTTTTGYLDAVLDAQERLTRAEEEFARAVTTYQVSIVNFERAQGNLLNYEDVVQVRTTDEDGLPLIELKKRDGGKNPVGQ